jgi:hypothetical protein
MEILKGGDKNKVECYDCDSLLEFNPRDVRSRYVSPEGPYEMEGYTSYTIDCPVCESTINVSSKITRAIGAKVIEIERQRQRDDYEL